MIDLPYSLVFGKWDFNLASGTWCTSTTNVENELGGPTWVGPTFIQ